MGELKGDFKVVFVVVDSTIPLAFVTMVVVVTPADVDWDIISLFDSFSLAILLLTSSVFRQMGTSAASTVFFPIGRSSLFSRLSWLFLLGMDLLRDSRALSVILLSSQHIFDLVFVRLGDFL